MSNKLFNLTTEVVVFLREKNSLAKHNNIIFVVACIDYIMPRSYQSGAQKRKVAEERKKEIQATLSKVPKLTSFFQSSTSHASSSASEQIESISNEDVRIIK